MQRKLGIGRIFIETFKEWVRDRSKAMAASLAYNELLSLAPLTGFILFLSFKILGDDRTRNDVIPILKHWFTPQFVQVVTFMLEQAEDINPNQLNTITILAGLALAWGAKEYFDQLKMTIEITWNKRRDAFGLMHLVKRMLATLKIAALAMIIIVLFLFLRAILPHPNLLTDGRDIFLINLIQLFIQFVFISTLFLFLFAYVPPVKVQWKNAVPGAILGAVFLLIGREVMKAHMAENPNADVAESFLVVLIWFYYTNLIFTFAAEFSKVYIASRQNIDVKGLRYEE